MKRLFYGVALIGIASIGIAFMNNPTTKKETKAAEWCVKLLCDGKFFYVTVIANNQQEAKQKAREIYPKCTGGHQITKGRCQ